MIFILDRIVSQPGQGQKLHDLYMAEYAPGARDRGMVLDRILVSPPLWLDDGVNRLLFLWRLPDTTAFWRKNELGRRDQAVRDVWARVDAIAAERQRDTLADPANFAILADV
jgi:hypothetical protein